MSWSTISFVGGFDSPDCQWMKTIFQHLYEASATSEYDELALYASKAAGHGVTLYLSPRATSRVRAAVSRYSFVTCLRPAAEDVELILGAAPARSTEWCESSTFDRWGAEMDVLATRGFEADHA
jgi:hypothetical protein